MEIRTGEPSESAEIASIIDAAYLQTDSLQAAVHSGSVLVAVATTGTGSGTILGTLVLDGDEITAIAVRPGRRGQGIGTALVTAARERSGLLRAEFDPAVRPFWEAVGFDVTEQSDVDRLCGVRQ